jgi:hypothetical protein
VSETNKIANLKHKKGHNSGKNCRKIVIIELTLDIHKIHLHTAPSFNLIFSLIGDHPQTKKEIANSKYKEGHNSVGIVEKSSLSYMT